MSTGRNYGDDTIAILDNEQFGLDHFWTVDNLKHLRYKREFGLGISLPHTWMPSFCGF